MNSEEKYLKEAGIRLKRIRSIFNEGSKLSGDQFAYLLDTNGDKIRNYETGRVAIPLILLLALYERGVNPIYIISGEGSMFAPNAAGREFERKVKAKAGAEIIMLTDEKLEAMTIMKAAAGRIKTKKTKGGAHEKESKPVLRTKKRTDKTDNTE